MSRHYFRVHTWLICVCLALMLSGCVHYGVDFHLEDQNFKPKGRSIAVISGSREEQSVVIASMLNDALRKTSRYQVMPSAQIAQMVKPYPLNIKGPYKSAYFQIDTDWDLGDRQKIAQIQRALGVEYLYVIWAPIAISTNGNPVLRVPVVAQLFEPGGKVVAKAQMALFVGDEGNQYLKEGTDGIAADLAEKTGMSTTKKVN